MKLHVYWGLFVALAACGCRDKPGAVKADLAQMQGNWLVESRVGGVLLGSDLPEESQVWRIKGNRIIYPDGEGAEQFEIVDPFATPKRLKLERINLYGKPQTGVYEIAGDTLKLCFGVRDEAFPNSFESSLKTGYWVHTLKRQPAP